MCCSVVAGAASAVVMAAYTQLRYLPFFVYNCVVALINNMTLIMALLIVWCNKNFIFFACIRRTASVMQECKHKKPEYIFHISKLGHRLFGTKLSG